MPLKPIPEVKEPTPIQVPEPTLDPKIAAEVQRRLREPKLTEDVPIKLDDQPRTLRMDFRAMNLIEEKLGLVMWRSESWNFDDYTPYRLSFIIWACLLHETPDITIEEVQCMRGMSLSNFSYITMKLTDLWDTTMPSADEAVDDDIPKQIVPA